MRGRRHIGGLRVAVIGATVAAVAVAALPAGGNVALVPPQPCSPNVVMNDAKGDGHHRPTDVLRAWLVNDPLQAVIEAELGVWAPEHDDPPVVGYAFLFTVNGDGVIRYVRLEVDDLGGNTWDHGTWTLAGGFASQGATTGERDPANVAGPAAAWIDIPASVADDGDVLTNTFVLTYDGSDPVDQAPGGVQANDPTRGPGFIVGSCAFVSVAASPASIKGAKTVTISGTVNGAAAGDPVEITRRTVPGAVAITNTVTNASGNYSVQVPVRETTFVQATANDIDSTTRKITVRSTVTIRAIRLLNGKIRIKGMARPALPGRVQLIKTTAFFPKAAKSIAGGAFSFRPMRLSPGRWQVIYTPSGGRAVRSISPAVRVR